MGKESSSSAFREKYFAGLRLGSTRGLSSDDVVLFKILESHPEILEGIGVIILPTLSNQDVAVTVKKTRIMFTYFSSWEDYVAITRPLSFSVEEVERVAQAVKNMGKWRVVASLASPRFSQLRTLAKRFSEKVDGFEIDLGLIYLLAGEHRGFESFAIDLVEEFVAESTRPVLVKLSPNMPLSQELLQRLVGTGVSGVVFTPHITYSIGGELFTLHSAHLSKLYALVWATLVAGSSISTAFVSDIPESHLGEVSVEKSFDLILFDTALLSSIIEPPRIEGSDKGLPVRWRRISPRLRLAVDIAAESYCTKVCPYGALEAGEREAGRARGMLVASDKCDKCGLCFSLCKSSRLVAILTPE